jgi:hypothetical protein
MSKPNDAERIANENAAEEKETKVEETVVVTNEEPVSEQPVAEIPKDEVETETPQTEESLPEESVSEESTPKEEAFEELVPEEAVIEEIEPEEPATEEPVLEEVVIEEPVLEEVVIEELIVEEPVLEEPVLEEPIIEELIVDEPVTEELVSEELVVDEPVLEEAVTEEAATAEVVIEELIIDEPVLEELAKEEVVIEELIIGEPATEELVSEEEAHKIEKLTKAEIIADLTAIIEEPASEIIRNKINALKQAFYKLKRTEIEEAKEIFVKAGGLEEEFQPEIDELEEKLKEFLAAFREKRASITAEVEKIKEENLVAKKAIIEKLKELVDSKEDFHRIYNEFRKLQQQWKEIKQVPQAAVNDLWKEYQHYTEKFYDLLKINNEMRDYDFKKNMELKQNLCEAVERLDEEKDVISAFYQLQNLHQEWREIGPVAKELREEVWGRFKKASSIINKKHQDHFESLRLMEQRNLEEKTAICEEMETIDYSKLTSFKEWDEQNKRVLELQEKWKTIGFAPKKNNVKIFERFRASCDSFFSQKSTFYKGIKETMEVNLDKKKALCEKAEALKESQDWKVTTDKLIAFQKEWKTIGPVSRKYSDLIWKRFISACDYFFEQKGTHFSSQKTEETDNLKKKKEIIGKISDIDESLSASAAIAQIRELMAEFNNVGYVPFRDKDKIYKEYRTAVDKHFDRLKVDESERRLQSFKSNLNEIAGEEGKSKNRLINEREKLMRTYERLKGDIQTYENNIGFLSVSSKGGSGLVKDMNRKIESLKEELDLIVKKIEAIDENLGFGNG